MPPAERAFLTEYGPYTKLETFCLQSKAGWDVYSLKAVLKKEKKKKKGKKGCKAYL